MITAMIVAVSALYAMGTIVVAVHLHDNLGLDSGYALVGGVVWPYVVYRAICNGYFQGFMKALDEATKK